MNIRKDVKKDSKKIDARDDPVMREISKMGKEINKMKSFSEPRKKIASEWEQEVRNVLLSKKNKEQNERIEKFTKTLEPKVNQFIRKEFNDGTSEGKQK